MQKFYDTVTDVKGNAVQGATIEVLDAGTSNQATIYEDDETTPKTNPITTGADGFYEFKAANGQYDIVVSRTGDEREVNGIILFDVDDSSIVNPETNDNDFVGDNTFAGTTAFKDGGELTISSGAITISATNHTVDTQSDASADDLDTINGASDGDVLFLRVADAARVVTVKSGTGNIVTSDGNDVVLDSLDKVLHLIYDADETNWVALNLQSNGGLPSQNVQNMIIANNSTDSEHDIDFQRQDTSFVGTIVVRDASNNRSKIEYSGGTITKQIDATWASGDDAGGLADALTVAADTIYYCFLITDGSTVDFGFDTSPSATNLLVDTAVSAAGLNKYRLIGSLITDGSANIIAADWREIEGGVIYTVLSAEIEELDLNPSADVSKTTITVNAPANVRPEFKCVSLTATTNRNFIFSLYDKGNDIQREAHFSANAGAGRIENIVTYIYTNSSSQVDYSIDQNGGYNGDFQFYTRGWYQER